MPLASVAISFPFSAPTPNTNCNSRPPRVCLVLPITPTIARCGTYQVEARTTSIAKPPLLHLEGASRDLQHSGSVWRRHEVSFYINTTRLGHLTCQNLCFLAMARNVGRIAGQLGHPAIQNSMGALRHGETWDVCLDWKHLHTIKCGMFRFLCRGQSG